MHHTAVRHLPALQGAQSGQQHRRLDRFDHVVISTGFQAENMIEVVFLGRQDDNRRVRHTAYFPAHMQTALPRQHQVEHHDFGPERQKSRHGQITAMHRAHLVAMLFEEVGDQRGQALIVFHQQDFAKTQVIHNDHLPTICKVGGIMAAIRGKTFIPGSKNRPRGPVSGDVSYS